MTTSARALVVHHHWVHYKDLLFAAMAKQMPSLQIAFLAPFHRYGKYVVDLDSRPYHLEVLSSSLYDGAWRFDLVVPMLRLLRKHRPDVVIVSGWANVAFWVVPLWCKVMGVKCVLWAESNEFDHARWRAVESIKRMFIRGCDGAHVYGTSNLEYLVKLGMPRAAIMVKRATHDTALFKSDRQAESYRPNGAFRLLYVGRFEVYKNVFRLIEAFEALQRSLSVVDGVRPTLTLIGFGSSEAALRASAAASEFRELIEVCGAKKQTELPEVYERHDVFVLPSLSEPWGLVVNEAMSCRLPCIVSTRCGCAHDLIDDTTGWTFDPEDTSALVEALRRAFELSPVALSQMGVSAAGRSRQYSPDATAERVCADLASVCSTVEAGEVRR